MEKPPRLDWPRALLRIEAEGARTEAEDTNAGGHLYPTASECRPPTSVKFPVALLDEPSSWEEMLTHPTCGSMHPPSALLSRCRATMILPWLFSDAGPDAQGAPIRRPRWPSAGHALTSARRPGRAGRRPSHHHQQSRGASGAGGAPTFARRPSRAG